MRRMAALALVLFASCALSEPDAGPVEQARADDEQVIDTAAGPNAYHFVAIGDWGTGYATQYELGRRMCRLHDNKAFEIVITAGDNIYEVGAKSAFDDKFYQPFACLLNKGVQFHSTLGNHDIVTRNGRPELNEPRFGFNGRNYILQKGGVRFVMADSNDLQKDWLRQAIQAEAGDRWTIVTFHHPVYSSSTGHPSTGDFRHTLPKMFERHGVDMVINGHTHLYALTKELDGIRYVTTGGGSAHPHDCKRRWYTARCVVRYHFLSIEAGNRAIHVTAVPPSGEPIDTFRAEGRQ